MCTKYEESLWLILNQFNTDNPVSIEQALNGIGRKEMNGISLYFRPVSRFIKFNLAKNRYLLKLDNGYILSGLGKSEKNKLQKVVPENAYA